MKNLEQAKEYFKNDTFAVQQTGIEIISAGEGYAKCSLKTDERHINSMGNIMGGVFFTLADYAFAIAANFAAPTTVTQTAQIVYFAIPKGDMLYAEAERVRSGRSTCFYKVRISDTTGADVAFVTVTGFIVGGEK